MFEEWEYHFASPSVQAMKYMMARTSPSLFPSSAFSDAEPEKITVYKYHSEVIYEYLLTPQLPFDLSFAEVFASLCDEVSSLYGIDMIYVS